MANQDHSLQRGQVRRKSGGLPSNKRSQDTGTTLKYGQERTNVPPGLSLPSHPGQHLTFTVTVPLARFIGHPVSVTRDALAGVQRLNRGFRPWTQFSDI